MNNPLNLLIISKYFPPAIDGVGDHTYKLIAGIKRQNPKIRIFLGTGELCAPPSNLYEPFYLRRWDKQEFASLRTFIEQNSIGKVIIQYVPYSFNRFGIPLMFLNRIRQLNATAQLIFVVHEARIRIIPWQKYFLIGIGQALSLRMIYHISQRIITSNTLYSTLLSKNDPLQKISIIPIGSNINEPHEKQLKKCSGNSLTIATFGQNFKGSTIILEALKLASQHIPDLKMLFIGRINMIERKAIEAKVNVLGLSKNVIITGPITSAKAAKLLEYSDLFIMKEGPMVNQWHGTSLRNGTFAAALQAGLPVIGYRGPITDSTLTNKPFLFLLEKYDGRNLAAAIKEYYKLPGHVKENLKKEASQFHGKNLSWEKISAQFMKVINNSRLS